MKIAALLGGLALLVAACVLLFQIGATREALQTSAAAPPAPGAMPADPAPGPDNRVPIPVRMPTEVAPPILAPRPMAPPGNFGAALPEVPAGARPPTGGTKFADPTFATDPQLRASVTEAEATRVAEGGVTAYERRTALEWLMGHGSADAYAVVQRVKANDPDPDVRTMAEAGVHVMQSRFPQFMGH